MHFVSPSPCEASVEKRGALWIVQNDKICLYVDPWRGTLSVRDKRTGIFWKQPDKEVSLKGPVFRDIRQIPEGLSFNTTLPSLTGKGVEVRVEITISSHLPQIFMGVDMDEKGKEMESFYFLEPFIGNLERGVIVIADYCNGHIYPFDDFPFDSWGADRLDMPWLGICDLAKGWGYALIIETCDDATLYFPRYQINGKKVVIPRLRWEPSKRKFSYKRRVIYHFVDKGGYVELAKAYRNYAREKGLLITLSEKMKENPNLEKLLGAADVWVEEALWKEDASFYLPFALEAKTFGVKRMLIQGRSLPENIAKVNSLGYITSEYDVYTDILPLEEGQEDVDPLHGRIPDDVVLMANGERMPGIFAWDTKLQFMKRCPALWVHTAKVNIPKVLQKYPFRGRFLDVVTAEGLYECYDENHPLTRGDKRETSVELLRYVRSLGLVVGSEHGIWWAVPVIDYIEGMMSGNPAHFSWPAGQLIRPKSKEEEFSDPFGNKLPKWELYEKWGIGHKWRVPLWELVFHDCVVSTWYWGDATDFLLQAAPEVTAKKDAFNILYGTIPLLWSRTWQSNRDVFLKSYRSTCKLHEVIGDKEMLSHEFLTPDHDVQKTLFSDGTMVVVNFGEKPYKLEFRGQIYLLPKNGFFVKGPKIEQRMTLKDGKVITIIKAPGYSFSNEEGGEVEMEVLGEKKMLIRVGKGKEVSLKPKELLPNWNLSKTRIFSLDSGGNQREEIRFKRKKDAILLGPFSEFTNLLAKCD
ncbi:hypothetical protein H5T87_10940 [bacterium]|nr:hypothetical protein [bacterium]